MPTERNFLSLRIRMGGMIDVLLLLVLVCSWVGYLARFHWFLALFDHFRLQGAVSCVVALVMLSWRKRWWLAGLALASLAANLWPLARTSSTLDAHITATSQPPLKVVSFNVLTSNTRYADTLNYLQAADADVILLMEISDVWEREMKPLRLTHPHGNVNPQADNFGIAIYSRLPLAECSLEALMPDGMRCVNAVVQLGNAGAVRELRFIGLHPLPPSNADAARKQTEELAAVAKLVSSQPGLPALVVGDFNTTPWSRALTGLREQCALDFRTPRPSWRPTWSARSGLFALPIDQALCTPQLFISKRELGPDVGSDHRAQELEISVAELAKK
jgi:endonuclease/exonuclease/phosphatase (EEP) superfamily protein YafD